MNRQLTYQSWLPLFKIHTKYSKSHSIHFILTNLYGMKDYQLFHSHFMSQNVGVVLGTFLLILLLVQKHLTSTEYGMYVALVTLLLLLLFAKSFFAST